MSRFIFGMFSYHCFISGYQDMVGKEMFIKKVSENWINTNVYMWTCFWLLGLFIYIFSRMDERPNISVNFKDLK